MRAAGSPPGRIGRVAGRVGYWTSGERLRTAETGALNLGSLYDYLLCPQCCERAPIDSSSATKATNLRMFMFELGGLSRSSG